MPKNTKGWRKTLTNIFSNDKINNFLKRLFAKFDRDVTVNFKLIDDIDQKVKIESGKICIVSKRRKNTCESAGEVVEYLNRKFTRGSNAIDIYIKAVTRYGENITKLLNGEFEKEKPEKGYHQGTVMYFNNYFINPISEEIKKFRTRYTNEIETTRAQFIDPVVNAYKKSSEKKNMEK